MKTLLELDPVYYGFNFENSYVQLPSIFHKKQLPTKVKNPNIVLFNDSLGLKLDLNIDRIKMQGSQFFAGNGLYSGTIPIAQAYAGHQFGNFNILGDGRAILLGEHITQNKQRFDIQLKGSGITPYSRSGDGRAALGPMLREYIISEAMHALGTPTTRSLGVTTTGEYVYRQHKYLGAVLTRIASSHIRVGTFQFAATTHNLQQLQALADYSISRHFPEIANSENKYLELLRQVIDLQASLIAKWMHVGFIHGVMNTDNMSICGETIDYGPCAFMNTYHPETVFSSIDANSRYAFGNQPNIAHWNLIRFAETLLPLIHESEKQSIFLATECLNEFPKKFLTFWLSGMRKKLGIFNQETEDLSLAENLLMHLQKNEADFTNTFRTLGEESVHNRELYQNVEYRNWLAQWKARLARQNETFEQSIQLMNTANPKVIPRNHLVEEALEAAVESGDMTLLNDLLLIVSNPYADLNHPPKYMQVPELLYDQQYKTYCGT